MTWTCRIINLKLETSDFCSFQIVNLIHDIIKNASLGRILPLMLCNFPRRSGARWLIASSSSSAEVEATVIPPSASITPGAPGREEQRCSAPCWWPCSEPLIENPAWSTKVWHLQKCTQAEEQVDASKWTRDRWRYNCFVWIYRSMRTSIPCILSPTRCYMCTWRICWTCLFEINRVPMPRGCEAIVFEHLWGVVRAEFNAGPQLGLSMEGHVTHSGADAASGHLWCVLAGLSSPGVELWRCPTTPPPLPGFIPTLVCSDLFSPVLVTLIFFFNPCCY